MSECTTNRRMEEGKPYTNQYTKQKKTNINIYNTYMKPPSTGVIYTLMCCTRVKRASRQLCRTFPQASSTSTRPDCLWLRLRLRLRTAHCRTQIIYTNWPPAGFAVRTYVRYVRLVGFYKAKCVKHLIIRILIGKHQSAALGPRHWLQTLQLWLAGRGQKRQTHTHTRANANVASNKLRRASNVAKQHDS